MKFILAFSLAFFSFMTSVHAEVWDPFLGKDLVNKTTLKLGTTEDGLPLLIRGTLHLSVNHEFVFVYTEASKNQVYFSKIMKGQWEKPFAWSSQIDLIDEESGQVIVMAKPSMITIGNMKMIEFVFTEEFERVIPRLQMILFSTAE